MKKRNLCRLIALLLAVVLAVPAGAVSYDEAGNEQVVIVLDPGHGGIDSGSAPKYDGVTVEESKLNWKIADYCRDYLEENYRNVQVYLTRETDEMVTLVDRVDFAESVNADYFLSIHLNSSNGYARGALALVPRGKYRPEQAEASVATAEAILARLEGLGLTNRGTVVETSTSRYPDGSYADAYYIVRYCVNANIPGIIMEHAFLDNEKDYRSFLSTEEQLQALGIADALGLAETLGLEDKLPPTSAELGDTPFTDVYEGDWFYDDVTYVWEQGLMNGVSDTEFGPDQSANRAMVVTLLYRLEGAEFVPEGCSFADVESGRWYHAPVEWALANGITTGVTETEFAPYTNVTRQQFVTFLHRYAGQPEAAVLPEGISDWSEVSNFARKAVAWAVEEGLMTGYSDGTIRPRRELTRAELAVLMHRFHEWILLNPREEEVSVWTLSVTEAVLYPGESFELTLINQFGEQADAEWTADTEGVVEISGTTVTAVGVGTVLLSCELDGQRFECIVEVMEPETTEPVESAWTLSVTEAVLYPGESFELTLTNQFGEQADAEWTADTEGVVEISGTTVTAVGVGTVLLSCELDGQWFDCFVEVMEPETTEPAGSA